MPGIRVALAAVADVSNDARVIEDVLGDVAPFTTDRPARSCRWRSP